MECGILGLMSMPLLQTKLHMPPLRAELVRRRRLTNHLEYHQSRKLTLISAPAGFGKTTLALLAYSALISVRCAQGQFEQARAAWQRVDQLFRTYNAPPDYSDFLRRLMLKLPWRRVTSVQRLTGLMGLRR